MDIVTIVVIVIIGLVILVLGGGLGFWIYIVTRTKKMTWQAHVYQLEDGTIDCEEKYTLSPLSAYTTDVIEKVDKKDGSTNYWLQKMKKAVPVVTADCVENWGGKKLVRVLLQEDTCTLLKTGYDRNIGQLVFRPMPHDRINMIKTELAERKERIQDKKDILAAIAPFVAMGIIAIALVIAVYVIVQGAIEASENNALASIETSKALKELSDATLIIYGYNPQDLNNTDSRQVIRENPPMPP